MLDNEQFLSTAISLGLLSNTQAARVREAAGSSGGRKSAVEAAKEEGFLTEAQVGTVLSSMFSRDSEGAGAQMVEGEHCVNHPDRLATRACYRCGNPLCPSCGWAEDGFVFCCDECLEIYRDERGAVDAAQSADARRRTALLGAVAVAVVVLVIVVAAVLWVVIGGYRRTKRGQDLFQKGIQSKGMTKVTLIKDALLCKPDIKGAREHIAEGYVEAGEYGEAEKSAREVLSRTPGSTRMKRVLVKALLGQNRVPEAVEIYRGMSGTLSTEEVRSFGISLFRDFNMPEEALEWLEKAFAAVEEDREVARLLGQYYMQRSDYKKAVEYLDKASSIQSTRKTASVLAYISKPGAISGAAVELGRAAAELDDYATIAEALKRVKNGLKQNISSPAEAVQVIEYMVPLAGDAEIVQLTRETENLAKAGQIPGLRRVQGLIAAREGKMEEAASLLETALAEEPEDKVARQYLVSFYLDQAQPDRARIHFEQLRAEGEEGFDMWLWEARLFSAEGHTEKARLLAEKILAEQGDVPKALAIAAEAYLKQGDFITAWRKLDRLCNVKPGPWAYLKAFLAAWRIGAEQSAGLYATRLTTGSASLAKDYRDTVKALTGVFSDEDDPTKLTDIRLVNRMRQIEAKAASPSDNLRHAYYAACMFNYETAVYAQYDNRALAEVDRRFTTQAIPARTQNPYNPEYITVVAESFKEGTVRLINSLAPHTSDGGRAFGGLLETMGRDYSLAASGPDKVAVCARALRDTGYALYQAACGGPEAAAKNGGFQLMRARHERENVLWRGRDQAMVGLAQAFEALVFAAEYLPNGFTVTKHLARFYGTQQEKVIESENALEQMTWEFISLARLVAALDFTKKVSYVEGALGRLVR